MGPSGTIDFSKWWVKESWSSSSRKGNPVVVTMENPNYSVVEIDAPDSAFQPLDKERGKNAKQFTWLLLLKAHRVVGGLAWLANSLCSLLHAVKKRLFLGHVETEMSAKAKFLFRVILTFLVMALAFLSFELVAHFKGWHYFHNHNLHLPQTSEITGWFHTAYVRWLEFRADYVAPPIQSLSRFCIVLFLIQSVDRILLCLGCFWIKFRKIKPAIDGDPLNSHDLEGSNQGYPMVLVQIPMCNEKEVTPFSQPYLSRACCFLFKTKQKKVVGAKTNQSWSGSFERTIIVMMMRMIRPALIFLLFSSWSLLCWIIIIMLMMMTILSRFDWCVDFGLQLLLIMMLMSLALSACRYMNNRFQQWANLIGQKIGCLFKFWMTLMMRAYSG